MICICRTKFWLSHVNQLKLKILGLFCRCFRNFYFYFNELGRLVIGRYQISMQCDFIGHMYIEDKFKEENAKRKRSKTM